MAGLWAGQLAEAALFLRSSGQSAPESPTAVCVMFTGTFSWGVKRPGREGDHQTQYSAEVKNMRNYISAVYTLL